MVNNLSYSVCVAQVLCLPEYCLYSARPIWPIGIKSNVKNFVGQRSRFVD